MKIPENVFAKARFVPTWQVMAVTTCAVAFIGGLLTVASHENLVVVQGAKCNVVNVTADSRDIRAELQCNTGSGLEKFSTISPPVVLDILRNNRNTVICNINADGRAKECKAS